MKRKLLDILACPIDKHYPLELIELNVSDETIIDGILFCSKCGRYYPIMDEIPIMLPDDLRDEKEDLDFLKKWMEKIPEKILYNGKPHHLNRKQ
ncbi:MAG: Trm112 family protein [Nitrososphaerales archaeon]